MRAIVSLNCASISRTCVLRSVAETAGGSGRDRGDIPSGNNPCTDIWKTRLAAATFASWHGGHVDAVLVQASFRLILIAAIADGADSVSGTRVACMEKMIPGWSSVRCSC